MFEKSHIRKNYQILTCENWNQMLPHVKKWYQILTHVKNRYKIIIDVMNWHLIFTDISDRTVMQL